jgi:two-component sensor histidine kinase
MYNKNSTETGNLPDIRKLLDEEKRRLKIFTSIASSCVDLTINHKEMLAVFVRKLAELTNDLSVICLFANDGNNVDTTSSYHPDDKIRNELWDLQKNYPLIIHEGIHGEIFETGLPFIVPLDKDKFISSGFLSLQYNKFLEKYSFSGMIVLPLNVNNKTIGILCLSHIDPAVPYTNDDQTFLQSIADLLASVIKNSRLYNEKEILLREMHHRIKNNLQVISSLLSIQSDYVRDDESHKLFINSLNRIRAMSMIHENLHQSDNYSGVDIGKYLKDLVIYLCRTYNINNSQVKLNINIGLTSLPIDSSITCGLIINELISNALKYAFPGDRSGNISLSLVKFPKQNKLVVSDNGIGLPEKMDMEYKDTFGLLLIRTLVDQLNGTLEVVRKNGAKFIIRFPHNSD